MRYDVVDVRRQAGAQLDRVLDLAVDRLRAGQILVHPTSTLYGIGAAATDSLDGEISRLKGRAAVQPLIRLAGGVEAIRRADSGVEWSDRCDRLAEAFWPGPLTLVVPNGTPAGLAVRIDGHAVTLELLRRYGGLMSSTSVNVSGRAPAESPGQVREALDAMPAGSIRVTFLDAGGLPDAGALAASTIVSLVEEPPRLLRAGAVGRERIEAVLREEVTA